MAALRLADAVHVEESPSTRAAMHNHVPIVHAQGFYTTASGGLGHGSLLPSPSRSPGPRPA